MSDRFAVLPQYIYPKQALTSFAGWVAGKERGSVTTWIVRRFVAKYDVNMAEALESDISRYASFNDFFTRALKPGARPIAEDQQFQVNLQTQGRLSTPEQFAKIVLRANPDGSILRVGDVARIEMGAQNVDTEVRRNGHPSVLFGVYLAPGANAVSTAASVQATLDRLTKRFPSSLRYVIHYDSTTFVYDTIEEVLRGTNEARRRRWRRERLP